MLRRRFKLFVVVVALISLESVLLHFSLNADYSVKSYKWSLVILVICLVLLVMLDSKLGRVEERRDVDKR